MRDRAEESSCESDCDCDSDLQQSMYVRLVSIILHPVISLYLECSDSDEAACLKKRRLPAPLT